MHITSPDRAPEQDGSFLRLIESDRAMPESMNVDGIAGLLSAVDDRALMKLANSELATQRAL